MEREKERERETERKGKSKANRETGNGSYRRSTRERASDAVLRSASPPATATPSRRTVPRWYRGYAPDPLPPASRDSPSRPEFDGLIVSEFCLKPDPIEDFFEGCCHGASPNNELVR